MTTRKFNTITRFDAEETTPTNPIDQGQADTMFDEWNEYNGDFFEAEDYEVRDQKHFYFDSCGRSVMVYDANNIFFYDEEM